MSLAGRDYWGPYGHCQKISTLLPKANVRLVYHLPPLRQLTITTAKLWKCKQVVGKGVCFFFLLSFPSGAVTMVTVLPLSIALPSVDIPRMAREISG